MLFISFSSAQSTDCVDVVSFAKSLRMNDVQPERYSNLQKNCCADSGVACNGLGTARVTSIVWQSMGLPGLIDGSAIPTALVTLDLTNNRIKGKIPENMRATSLVTLGLSGNMLEGDIPALPATLKNLALAVNNLNGVMKTLPSALEYLFVYYNQLQGSIPAPLPSNLITFSVFENNFSGKLSTLPNTLVNFGVFGNLFTGDLPTFPPSSAIIYVSYHGWANTNKFSGSLNAVRPKELSINGNLITDVVIQETNDLAICDLSYNPLLENANIVHLKMCAKSGLYSPKLLPNTRSIAISTTSAQSLPTGIVEPGKDTSKGSSGSTASILFFGFIVACILALLGRQLFKRSKLQAENRHKLFGPDADVDGNVQLPILNSKDIDDDEQPILAQQKSKESKDVFEEELD